MSLNRFTGRVAAGLVLVALAIQADAAPPPPPPAASYAPPTFEQLTAHAAALDKVLRSTSDPVERKRLIDDLEKVKHQIGPVDANGARVRCQAMWHDAAIESLDQEMKRLAARPAADLRLAVRRMARACLAHGWRIPDSHVKYQVDVFGAYLANNLRTLDGLSDSVAAGQARDSKASDLGDAASAHQKAAEKARQGVARMSAAAEAMAKAKAPSDPPAPLVPMFGEFVGGLRAVREADDAMRNLARKKGKATPAAPGEASSEPEAPPMTDAEKKTLETIRSIGERLKGDGWAEMVWGLTWFVRTVEAGFQVTSARPHARELLATLDRAATMAESLAASKVAYPEYLEMRQKQLGSALKQIDQADTRAAAYASLAWYWRDDEFRRRIEVAGLMPAASEGLVRALYEVAPRIQNSGETDAYGRAQWIRDGCRTVADTLEKTAGGPPKDMAPPVRDALSRLQKDFRSEIEQAGAAFPADPKAGAAKLGGASAAARSMDLVLRVGAVMKTITKLRPTKAQAILTQMMRPVQDMMAGGDSAETARQTLGWVLNPFEELSTFQMPEPELSRSVNTLVGRAYGPAMAAFDQAIIAGLDAAAGGDALPLRQAVVGRHMFSLLRRRAQATVYRLEKAVPANLVTFSVPEGVWSKFVPTLDQKMQATFAQYGSQGAGRAPSIAAMAEWDMVYADVAAGQRLTLDGLFEGETDLDLLMRNLERASLASPERPTAQLWAVGYHATEAAAAMNAGFDVTASYHRGLMRSYDAALRAVDLAPPKREARR
jgi:hypothetical protein